EDGIRDFHVTGVQTCALPISRDRGKHDRGRRQMIQVYEYPVWFMHQWPFVKLGATGASQRLTAIAGTVSANFRLFRDFNVVCDRSEERRVGKEGRCRGGPEQ